MTLSVVETDFNEIYPFWRKQLWPQRLSAIEPVSWIDVNGQINAQLQFCQPFFWKACCQDNIIGVISGYLTSPGQFRSRGIWVDDSYRRQNVGRALMEEIFKRGRELGAQSVWSMPRSTAREFYLKMGFEMRRSLDAYEYGPHYLALRSL